MKQTLLNVFMGLWLLLLANPSIALDQSGAYFKSFREHTEIMLEKGVPIRKLNVDIVFHFSDEKSINLYRDYHFYYSFFDKLEDIKAETIIPEGNGKTKTLRLKDIKYSTSTDDDIFHDDQTEVTIDFLGLVPGSEVHIEYTITSRESHYSHPMFFKRYLPIESEEYVLTVPRDVHISLFERNIPQGFLQRKIDEKKKETIYTFTALDVPKEHYYNDIASPAYYTPFMIYKIDEYEYDGKMVSYCKSVDDIYRWYACNIKDVNKESSPALKALADSLCKYAKSPIEKAKAIFDWVKTNIRYVAFEAGMDGLVPRNATAICDKRFGDCKDMTSLQYGLMKEVGLEPHYTWIGTISIPFNYSDLPLKNADNHMINSIFLNNEWLFLDATDATGEFGIPSDHIQGKQALIGINEKEYKLVTVPVVAAQRNVQIDSFQCKLSKLDLMVNWKNYFKGYWSGSMKSRFSYMTEKEREDYAKDVVKIAGNNAELIRFKPAENNDFDGHPLEYDLRLPFYAREAGKELYLNLFLHKVMLNELISDTSRRAPMSYRFNTERIIYYDLEIPEGYQLDFVPNDSQYTNEHFSYSISYNKSNQHLTCTQKLTLNFPHLLLDYSEFEPWNKMINTLNKAYKESIVLKK